MSDEHRALARARQLAENCEELAGTVASVLGASRAAGLDPDALRGLIGAGLALGGHDAGIAVTVYTAGRNTGPRHGYPSEHEFTRDLTDTEDEIADAHAAALRLERIITGQLGPAAEHALQHARRQHQAATAMSARNPCDGCHQARHTAISAARDAIRDASGRINALSEALAILAQILPRLSHARARIRAVPADLGETYESVYNLIRAGGRMPHRGRWIDGGLTA